MMMTTTIRAANGWLLSVLLRCAGKSVTTMWVDGWMDGWMGLGSKSVTMWRRCVVLQRC